MIESPDLARLTDWSWWHILSRSLLTILSLFQGLSIARKLLGTIICIAMSIKRIQSGISSQRYPMVHFYATDEFYISMVSPYTVYTEGMKGCTKEEAIWSGFSKRKQQGKMHNRQKCLQTQTYAFNFIFFHGSLHRNLNGKQKHSNSDEVVCLCTQHVPQGKGTRH